MLALGLSEGEAEIETDGLAEIETDGLTEADSETLTLVDGLAEGDKLILRETDVEGEADTSPPAIKVQIALVLVPVFV